MIRAVLDWVTDRSHYDRMLAEAGQSDLLQCWAWGEAKAETEGWRPRRAILSVAAQPIALVQVLERRFGPVRLARINRGPTWLTRASDLCDAQLAVLARLRAEWRWWRGGALLIAPNWSRGEDLHALGYRPRSGPAWCSSLLSLEPEPESLRKALVGKWRNMLVNAEKAGLSAEILVGQAGLDWLLPRYRAMLAEKGFAATPPELLQALGRHAGAGDLMTLVISQGDSPASAVLMVRHGGTATYLVGWNNELGRQVRGNHLALWQAMLALRGQGCGWLDLGGIDAVLTPGIASFKRGLKGEEFTLAGEFLSL